MASENHSVNIYLNEADVTASLQKMQTKASELEEQMTKAANQAEFDKLSKQLNDTNNKISTLDKQLKGELNPSMRQMEQAIAKTRNELKNMATGTDEFNAKAKQLREAEDNLKKVQAEAKGVNTAMGETAKGAGIFGTLKQKAMDFASGLPGIGTALSAMMGPFGLLLGIAAGLVAIVRENAEVADKLSFAWGGLRNVIRAMADGLVSFMKDGLGRLKEAINNPRQALIDFGELIKEQIINRFQAVGLIVTAIAERDFGKLTDAFLQLGTGVTDAGAKVAAFGSSMVDAFNDGYEAAEKLDALGLQQARLQNAITRTQIAIEQQTTAMKNSTLSDEEKLAAANKIIELETLNANRRIQMIALELNALDQQTAGRVRNGEEETKLMQLQTAMIQAEVDKQSAIRKASNLRDAIEQKMYYDKVNIEAVQSMQATAMATDAITADLTKKTSNALVTGIQTFKSYAEAQFQEFQTGLQSFLGSWGSVVQAGVGLIQNVFSLVSQQVQQNADEEMESDRRANESKKKEYKAMLDNKQITQKQYNNYVEAADKQLSDKEREQKKKTFESDKAMKLTMAAINTALAVINALATAPFPASIVMAALAAATGLVQIGVIAAAPAPQFAKGGVARGASHSAGGISMINSDGTKVGEMEGDEPYMILSRDTYKNNGPIIDALLHTSMNRGGAKLNMGSIPMFNFGGVWKAMNTVRYASGGVFVPQQANDNASLQLLASIDEKLSNPVRAEVVYEDITDRGSALNRASGRGSFSKT